MSEETYYTMLERLSAEKSPSRVNNSSAEHAADFLYVLISNAEKNINIVSQKLSVYADEWLCRSFKRVLDSGVKAKILLDGNKAEIENNEFLTIAKDHKNCQIRIADKKLSGHIVTRDGVAYRYCADTSHNTAFGSFNQPEIVQSADSKLFGSSYKKHKDFS